MPQAYLFDMDGVLVDSEPIWVHAVREAVVAGGGDLSTDDALDLVIGHAWSDIYAEINKRYPGRWPTIDDLSSQTDAFFAREMARRDISIPNSIALLRELSATHPTAVVSGSSRKVIEDILSRLELNGSIRFILGTEDYSPGKPHPACYLKAAKRLRIPPANCLVFEDSAAGVRAAKAAGMYCIALQLPDHPPQDLSPADAVLDDLGKAPAVIHRLQKGEQ